MLIDAANLSAIKKEASSLNEKVQIKKFVDTNSEHIFHLSFNTKFSILALSTYKVKTKLFFIRFIPLNC